MRKKYTSIDKLFDSTADDYIKAHIEIESISNRNKETFTELLQYTREIIDKPDKK